LRCLRGAAGVGVARERIVRYGDVLGIPATVAVGVDCGVEGEWTAARAATVLAPTAPGRILIERDSVRIVVEKIVCDAKDTVHVHAREHDRRPRIVSS